MVYAEFGGQTECIMGNWKIENLRELNRDGGLEGERGGLFNLEKTMVSVLHRELEYKAEETLKNKKVGGHAAEDQNQIRTSSW